jgi:hypothetical protein
MIKLVNCNWLDLPELVIVSIWRWYCLLENLQSYVLNSPLYRTEDNEEKPLKKCWRYTLINSTFLFNFIHLTFFNLIQGKSSFYACWTSLEFIFFKDNSYYRWVTRYTSDSTLDQRNQIRHRPAEVVIPWTLPLPFIEIMKGSSLYRTTISTGLRAPDTVIEILLNNNWTKSTIIKGKEERIK